MPRETTRHKVHFLQCLLLMVLQQVSFASNNIKCHNFVNMTVGDVCQKSWKHIQPQLHPTQPLLGYSWVVYKATTLLTSTNSWCHWHDLGKQGTTPSQAAKKVAVACCHTCKNNE